MKLLKEVHAQIWTVCGTLLVLYTLTGQTLKMATWTFIGALALHFIGTTLPDDEEDS